MWWFCLFSGFWLMVMMLVLVRMWCVLVFILGRLLFVISGVVRMVYSEKWFLYFVVVMLLLFIFSMLGLF